MIPVVLTLLLGAVTQSDTFTAVKTSSPPPAGSITAQWRSGVSAGDFMDFTDRRPARYATQAYLLYDDKYLYVAFYCAQAGTPLTAAQHIEHAGVSNDDHVGFGIDTSGNGSRTYQFRVNPLGVHDESSTENARYAPDWQSSAHVDASGNYEAFLAIPLAAIRAQGGAQRWRFNFERFIAAANADQTWAYSPAMQSISSVQYWPWLTGMHLSLSATRPKPQADAYVLQSAGSQADVFQNGIGRFEEMHSRPAGLDVTYPFTNTLAFVGTLDPDFSNVEEDQTTIEPQEFQKAYQEYRPFFAQGAQYINALPQISLFGGGNVMFYSPSIGVFNRGLKIEGTSGNNAVGLLNVLGPGINDNAAGYAYAADNGSLVISAESVLANHDGLRDDTEGVGVQRLNRHSGEQTQIEFASETGSSNDSGHDLNFAEGLQNQHFTALAYYRDTSLGYHPADGYTAVSDARGPGVKFGYAGTGSQTSPLLSYSLNLFGDRYLASDGTVREADINGFYNVQFKDLLSLQGFFGPSELQTAPGVIQWFNRRQIQLGYRLGTPQPVSFSYTWGPFAGGYVEQTQFLDQRVFGANIVSVEYDGNVERRGAGAPVQNSQWLRRVAFSRSFGANASIGLQVRSISGTGGFAEPGTNLSVLYQQRFASQDLLYLEYGTPAAPRTLRRFILKYVFHAGGQTGT